MLSFLPTFLEWPYTVLIYLVYIALTFISFIVLKLIIYEIAALLAIRKVSKIKGVKVAPYYPILGFVSHFLNQTGQDGQEKLMQEIGDTDGQNFLVYNSMPCPLGRLTWLVTSTSTFKEYLTLDAAHTYRDLQSDLYPLINVGFLGDNSEKGLKARSIFIEFFFYDRIQKLKDPMLKIMENKLKTLPEKYGINKEKFVEFDLRDFMSNIMQNWISNLMFGCENEEDIEIDLDSPECALIKDQEYAHFSFKNYKKISLTKLSVMLTEVCVVLNRDLDFLLSGG